MSYFTCFVSLCLSMICEKCGESVRTTEWGGGREGVLNHCFGNAENALFLQWGFPNDKSNIEPLKWGIKQKFIAHKIFPKLRLSNPLKTTELENMKNFIKR